MTKRIITPGDPGFYINKNNYLELEFGAKTGVAGFFGGRALKGGRVMREFGFEVDNPNLLTDIGLNALSGDASVPANFIRMHLGTGTTPPAFSDGQLTNFGVSVQNANPGTSGTGNGGSPNYYGWRRYVWTSTIGGATGNWTEIGISSSNTNTAGALRSHALILDNSANPTVFPVLADEQFQGYYELRCYPYLTDDVRTVNVGGVPHDVVTRVANAGSWIFPPVDIPSFNWFGNAFAHNGVLGAVTGAPSNGIVNGQYPALTPAAYSSGNLYRDYKLQLSPSQWVATFRGWSQTAAGGNIFHQHHFDPAIVKTNVESMIFNLRHSWARR